MKHLIIFFLICCVFSSCGYFENDGVVFEKEIIGNFKIQQQGNATEKNLIYTETPEVSSVIVNDCKKVFYNPTDKKVIVSKDLNEYNTNYYLIAISDKQTAQSYKNYSKKEISKNEFDKMSNNSKFKIII